MEQFFSRCGNGYDSHRFITPEEREQKYGIVSNELNTGLRLCGVQVPFDRVFKAHSDGDLAVHALIDSLLGAAALGNIGLHFPDTDPKYKGADSMKLLGETVRLLKSKEFKIFNADITIVLQKPKIADYVEQMRENIAKALEIGKDFVNVKGKTNEKMDDVGSEVGAMAFASASVLQKVDLDKL